MRTPTDLIKDLEQRGEASVKAGFLNGDYKPPTYEIVKEWLSSKESERAEARAAEARAEESLSNSRKALRVSRLANNIAITAIIIAIIAIAVAIVIAWFQRK
jgi:subtilase family serine protease